MKKITSLTLLLTLFFGNSIFSEQIALGCDATNEYSTYYYYLDGKLKKTKAEEKKENLLK